MLSQLLVVVSSSYIVSRILEASSLEIRSKPLAATAANGVRCCNVLVLVGFWALKQKQILLP
ncbi:hypothetical protein HanXRQr2_Chr04g0173121 [Helianthus annuus]|uniref:Uncharacterized protein n=1 Tax=Helianthus annuus TaxID=4232 RepID=A0A9K3J8I4_HELAN|nr:hypothetical protein HanXRQr2_Chr04g0173121 [Helianthus annuus]